MDTNTVDSRDIDRQAFANLARDISRRQLRDNRTENDRYPFGPLFQNAIDEAGNVGFYGMNLPEEFGGIGSGAGMLATVVEQISRVDASLAAVVITNAVALEVFSSAAKTTDDTSTYHNLVDLGVIPLAFPTYINPFEIELPIIDASSMSITGKIDYLVLGNIAKYAVIPAKHIDQTAFSFCLIDLHHAAIEKSKPVVSLGLHACEAVDITMHNVSTKYIGTEGQGQQYFDMVQQRMSVCSAAISLGIMQGSFEDALQYTSDRYQGGRQIVEWDQVRMLLADMAIMIKMAESSLAMACQQMERNIDGWEQTAQAAAIYIGEMATRACTDGVQLFGGNGYMKDYPQEKRMRDARQVQSLLGLIPLRKLNYIGQIISHHY